MHMPMPHSKMIRLQSRCTVSKYHNIVFIVILFFHSTTLQQHYVFNINIPYVAVPAGAQISPPLAPGQS